MKTSLTLSTVLCALMLTPAAFANGAQEQTEAVASTATAAPSTSITVFTVQQLPEVTTVTRSVLEQLDLDVREGVLSRLRANSNLVIEAMQIAAPALAVTVSKSLDLSSR